MQLQKMNDELTMHSMVLTISYKACINNSMCGSFTQSTRPPLITTQNKARMLRTLSENVQSIQDKTGEHKTRCS